MGTDAKGLGDGPEDKFRLVCITSTFPFISKTYLVQLVKYVQIVIIFHLVHIPLLQDRLHHLLLARHRHTASLEHVDHGETQHVETRNHDQSLIAGGGLLEHKVSYS